jgi:hypothetical protein
MNPPSLPTQNSKAIADSHKAALLEDLPMNEEKKHLNESGKDISAIAPKGDKGKSIKTKKGILNNIVNMFSQEAEVTLPKKNLISTPFNPIHIAHVGFDPKIGEFTVVLH